MKTTIYYLGSDYVSDRGLEELDREFFYEEWCEAIKNHDQVEVYTPLDFEDAFNAGWISDLGYIVTEQI